MTLKAKDQTVAIVSGRATPNRLLRQIVKLASGSHKVVEVREVSALDPDPATTVVTCWAEDASEVSAFCDRAMPGAAMIVWLPEAQVAPFEIANHNPRIMALIAWPPEEPLPAIWQLASALQRVTRRQPAALSPLTPLRFDGMTSIWYPRTTEDLFATIDDLREVLERLEIDGRTARRVLGVAHEMLMNAMYDAPSDNGRPRFAHDRTQKIALGLDELPSLILATDGLLLSLQVSDPFGGLRREHVYRSLMRGLKGQNGVGGAIDTSGGGAGLGLHRIIDAASATVFDIVESRLTNVTTTFDLGQSNRERRRAPKSLLYFQRAEPR